LARGQPEAGRLAERARITRDLHDRLAQELAGSSMLLQAADFDRRPDLSRTQVRAVVDALGTNLASTRTIIGDLTPPALEHDDLSTRPGPGRASPRRGLRGDGRGGGR
jgi:signal transduction histidine kinase